MLYYMQSILTVRNNHESVPMQLNF